MKLGPSKLRHVLRGRNDGNHTCHWPGCGKLVPPAMWGCRDHWMALPYAIRHEIWRTYRPGQEVSKTPSEAYIAAARAAQDWIRDHAPGEPMGKLL